MTRTFKALESTHLSLVVGLSRLVLGLAVICLALIGFALMAIPAVAGFLAMEWTRARRWFSPR